MAHKRKQMSKPVATKMERPFPALSHPWRRWNGRTMHLGRMNMTSTIDGGKQCSFIPVFFITYKCLITRLDLINMFWMEVFFRKNHNKRLPENRFFWNTFPLVSICAIFGRFSNVLIHRLLYFCTLKHGWNFRFRFGFTLESRRLYVRIATPLR